MLTTAIMPNTLPSSECDLAEAAEILIISAV